MGISENKNNSVSCLICHVKIFLDPSNEKQGLNELKGYGNCVNGHTVHLECLKKWIAHSDKCPMCNSIYPPILSSRFSVIINEENLRKEEKEKEKKLEEIAISAALEEVKQQKNDGIRDKINRAKILIDSGKFKPALNILFDILDHDDPQNIEAKFLIGKTHYLNNKFDLAVSNLMKLVKTKFDFPLAFYYLGKSFESINLKPKAKWAYERSLNNLEKLITNHEMTDISKKKFEKLIEEIKFILSNLI